MGTTWSVKLVAPDRMDLHALHAGVQAQLDDVVAQMSNWEPDSDLSRYNTAPAGTWHALPDGFWTVLSCALTIAHESGGAYDPTVGPLVDGWGFGPPGRREGTFSPEAVRAQVGWQRVITDARTRRALQPGGTCLDLCAIAKGHGGHCTVTDTPGGGATFTIHLPPREAELPAPVRAGDVVLQREAAG